MSGSADNGLGSDLGIAMLGAGFIAEYHLAGIAAAVADVVHVGEASTRRAGDDPPSSDADVSPPRAVVRVIAARTREHAIPLAAKYGIAGVVTDWRSVLERSDIDAVVICTPDPTHEEIAIAAAGAGKAILLQKPMAGTVAACRRIIVAADRAGVDLQVSFMHRYFPEVIEARRLLADRVIGRVHSVSIRNATPGPDWSDWFFSRLNVTGGVVDQLGVHGIDLALQLCGDVRDVSARTDTLLPSRRLRDGRTIAVETADTAYATYRFVDHAIASHEMSMIEVKGCDRFRLELYGDQGTIWLRSERGPLAIHAPDRFGDGWHCPELPMQGFGALHHRDWLDGVAGRAPRRDTARDALRGMEVVEAIRRSSAANGAATAVGKAAA